jgi:hypothetical protein
MKRASALIFAICGLILLLTWHHQNSWYWIWERAQGTLFGGFSVGLMDDLDFVLKIAGLAFVGLAVLLFQKADSPSKNLN